MAGEDIQNSPKYEKKMVVMHVCFLNPENQSGYETRVVEETSLLQKLGVRIILACFIGSNHLPYQGRIIKLYRRLKRTTGAKIYILPTSHYFDLSDSSGRKRSVIFPLIALARLHNVDILHGQALYSTGHILDARKRLKVKVVFDVHGASPEETEMSGGNISRIKRLQEWEQEALNSVDLRIFVSSHMQSFFKEKYGLPDHPHVVIPCCVHSRRFEMKEEDRLSKKAQLGITDKFVFLYLGTLSVWQWPEAMFSLFAQFHREKPDSVFYLLLPQVEHDKAVSFCEKHKLPPTSYIIDEVPHSEVGSVIGAADVGLLLRKAHPVNYVSSPTKFGEYLAAGVPVIATEDIGDTSDIIRKKNVGLLLSVEDGGVSEKELSRLLHFADSVKRDRAEWSERCRSVGRSLLEWSEHGRILANAYKN